MPKPKPINNETLERVLDAADDLFSRRGFADVTLRDIAQASGIHHSSLYYYAPGGKEQLYADVMNRNLARHRAGIQAALLDGGEDLHHQLLAVARWFLSQPMLDMARMSHSDLRSVTNDHLNTLVSQTYGVHQPIIHAIQEAVNRGEIGFSDSAMAAYAFVSMVQGLNAVPRVYQPEVLDKTLEDLVNLFLFGLKGA